MGTAKRAAVAPAPPVLDDMTDTAAVQSAPIAQRCLQLVGAGSFTPLNFPALGCIRKGQTVRVSGAEADYLLSTGFFAEAG